VRMSTDGALADSYVGLVSRIWITNPNRANFLKVRGEYVTAVKQRFDAVGIDIPYPQLDLSGTVDSPESTRLRQSDLD
jgi:small conductance mechanosensitive channel